MSPIVPCLVAFFAPLQAASAAPVAPPVATPQASFAPQSPGIVLGPTAGVAGGYGLSNPSAPQIVVPDERRVQLLPTFGGWWLGSEAPPLPEAALVMPPPAHDLFVRVRKQVRDQSLTPAVAASLLVESAAENERVGHLNLAREDLELALERDPTHPEARRMRAERRYAAGDYYGALRDAEARLASRPTSRAARFERASLLAWCGRPAEAHRELTALIREDPGRPEYYTARAAASFQLGDDWDADLDSEIAVELAPADLACRLVRMKTCLAKGDRRGAYDQYEAVYEAREAAKPHEVRGHVELLVLTYENFPPGSDRPAEVMAALDWMVKASPEFNPPRHLLAGEYLNASRPDLAEQVATEALDRDPVDARAFHLRGLSRAALAHPDAARDLLTALSLDDTAATRAELVKLHRTAGRYAEARGFAEAGVELHPECGVCRQFLADDDLRRGDFAAAERHATCALWLARDRADATAARLTRTLARLALGDADGAAGDLAELPVTEEISVPLVVREVE